MNFDSGRLKDLEQLEYKLKYAPDSATRQKIQSTIDHIKRQAQNPELTKERELLMNARRAATNAVGEINIKNAREQADKLEEQIHREVGS